MRARLDLPEQFLVRVWADPVLDAGAHDAFGSYAEAYWLPHVGPSTFLVARRMLAAPGPWDKAVLAAAVGIGHRGGTDSALERALARLVSFHLADAPAGEMYVRRYWPRIPPKLLARMPTVLQAGESDLAA